MTSLCDLSLHCRLLHWFWKTLSHLSWTWLEYYCPSSSGLLEALVQKVLRFLISLYVPHGVPLILLARWDYVSFNYFWYTYQTSWLACEFGFCISFRIVIYNSILVNVWIDWIIIWLYVLKKGNFMHMFLFHTLQLSNFPHHVNCMLIFQFAFARPCSSTLSAILPQCHLSSIPCWILWIVPY